MGTTVGVTVNVEAYHWHPARCYRQLSMTDRWSRQRHVSPRERDTQRGTAEWKGHYVASLGRRGSEGGNVLIPVHLSVINDQQHKTLSVTLLQVWFSWGLVRVEGSMLSPSSHPVNTAEKALEALYYSVFSGRPPPPAWWLIHDGSSLRRFHTA